MLNKNIRTLLLTLLVALMLLPTQALAARPIDVHHESSLRVQVTPDGMPQVGVEMRLYQVAVVSRECLFTLTGEFEDYAVSLNDNDSDSWRELATTLEGYVRTDKLEPTQVVETGEDGIAAFEHLATGLYLVVADRWYVSADSYYIPSPILVSLPSLDTEDKWVYDITVNAKLTAGWIPPVTEYAEISVLKIWQDEGSDKRPVQIEAELYNNDQLVDTVTLSKENNWQHTWTKLDPNGVWIVREKDVSEGYTVSVEKQGTRFVLTNTLEQPPEDPDDPDTPPDEPDTPPDEPELPQTGVLWWPVPVLMAAGLFFLLVGAIRQRRDDA